uniref:(California timema) hypothetical protein n=1 Tax=Timema californicum TaxID=61474 RepID=A0A7R9PF16_TIMCA|nr:unnamed protein product [Timema californicum]
MDLTHSFIPKLEWWTNTKQLFIHQR